MSRQLPPRMKRKLASPPKRRLPPPKRRLPPKRKRRAPKVRSAAELFLSQSATQRKKHPTWRRLYKMMLKSSLAFYATETLRGPKEYGGKFLLGPHHLEWSQAVQDHDRILSLAARDHGKSHFFCFAYAIWMVDRVAPGKEGYIFSASGKQAEKHLNKIRQEIVGGGQHGGPNPKLAHLLPFKKDNAGEIVFANGSAIFAVGFGSKVRGGHPWWGVGDDMGNDEWIWSETVRKKAIDYFLSAIRPMIVPGGQLIVVGTPFHSMDLYKYLDDTDVYHVMRHPARDPKTGAPLWPARYGEKELQQARKELGSQLRFSREYLCQPITDESSLFPGWLFETPGIKQPYALGLKYKYWTDRGMSLYVGVDLAMSASVGGDYLVTYVMAIDNKGNRWIVDIVRRKGLGYQEQVDLIVRVAKRYRASLVFCEANQYQRVISDMVVKTSDVSIKAFYTTGKGGATNQRKGISSQVSGNKNALDKGVPALRMLFENAKVRIPWAKETRETVKVWIDEMQSFGWADGKLQGVGAHDDTVMAMWLCDQAIAYGSSFSYDFGDQAAKDAANVDLPDYWEDDPAEIDTDPEPELDFFGGASEADDWRPIEGVGLTGPRW